MIAERMRALDPSDARPRAALRLMFPATEDAVRAGLLHCRRAMRTAGMCTDLTGRAEIVLAEALNNITEHGRPDGQTGWISLRCDLCQAGLRVVITDRCRPLPQDLLAFSGDMRPMPGNLDLADLPEGGFGWHLIRLLTHDLACKHEAFGNRLSFLVPRNPGKD